MPKMIADLVGGKTKLWIVFWVYGFAFSVVSNIGFQLVSEASISALRCFLFVALGLSIFWTLSLWRCAFNCRHIAIGYFVRASVVVSLLAIPLFVYAIVANPISFKA